MNPTEFYLISEFTHKDITLLLGFHRVNIVGSLP